MISPCVYFLTFYIMHKLDVNLVSLGCKEFVPAIVILKAFFQHFTSKSFLKFRQNTPKHLLMSRYEIVPLTRLPLHQGRLLATFYRVSKRTAINILNSKARGTVFNLCIEIECNFPYWWSE